MAQQPGHEQRTVPVRMYHSDHRIMVAAPLPGLEPADISVTVADRKLTIQGNYRGPRQEERDLVLAEWTVGPYFRELELPQTVNGALTNATYGNGVLVLVMPKLEPGQHSGQAAFKLEVVEAPRGQRVGHTGRDMRETTTGEHRQHMADAARKAGQPRGS